MAELREWFKAAGILGIGEMLPPGDKNARVTGKIYGHPRYPDGDTITPSILVARKGNSFSTRSGSVYDLGEPKAEYREKFPNAMEEILASVPDQDQTQIPHADSTQIHPVPWN